jgi:hypothetical protein
MNCKQGEIAIVVRSKFVPDLLGRIVEVLHAAPSTGSFRLPNGQLHHPLTDSRFCWVCKFQSPVFAPSDTGPIKTHYAPVPDECLRPIRDQPGEDEMLRIAGLPNKQPEVA